MEELSESTRNMGQEVGVSHEIQTGHFRMQVRRHTARKNLLDQLGSPRIVSFFWEGGGLWRHFYLSMKPKSFSIRSVTTYTYIYHFGFLSGRLYSQCKSLFFPSGHIHTNISRTGCSNSRLPAKQNRRMCCSVCNFHRSRGNTPLHASVLYDIHTLIEYMFRPNSRQAAGLIQERVPHVLELHDFKAEISVFYALTYVGGGGKCPPPICFLYLWKVFFLFFGYRVVEECQIKKSGCVWMKEVCILRIGSNDSSPPF